MDSLKSKLPTIEIQTRIILIKKQKKTKKVIKRKVFR